MRDRKREWHGYRSAGQGEQDTFREPNGLAGI